MAEIGEFQRLPTKRELASYAGVVPPADNSGGQVSWHRKVKSGNLVLKRFLCNAVMGMLLAKQEMAVRQFYRKKAKQIGQAKAQVAAARKLSKVVWWILTYRTPYREQDESLTARKEATMERVASNPPWPIDSNQLQAIGDALAEKASILDQLHRSEGPTLAEEEEEGNG